MRISQAAQSRKSTIYQVTLPNGEMVISSRPLLHNEDGSDFNTDNERAKEHDGSAVLFLAYFELLNVMPDRCVSRTKLPAFRVWNNICAFLFGKPFYLAGGSEFPSKQLARFSIAISCPHLLFATDEVVHAALCGDEALAQRMIAANPRYLLARSDATDFSGRKYENLTPFQAALITGDEKMAEMMMELFFTRLPNGEAIMQTQAVEIFPQGVEAHIAAQKKRSETDFARMLDAVIKAIKDAKPADLQAALSLQDNGSALCEALAIFRGAFTELSHSEKIFNPQYLLKAFEAYVNQFKWERHRLNWNELDLFWRQVIGFVQRFLPANYAQAFAYSLYDMVENERDYPRSFNFIRDPGFSFYPLSNSFTGLGFDHGAMTQRAVRCERGWGRTVSEPGCYAAWRYRVDRYVAKLISSKNSELSKLITPPMQSTRDCVIQ